MEALILLVGYGLFSLTIYALGVLGRGEFIPSVKSVLRFTWLRQMSIRPFVEYLGRWVVALVAAVALMGIVTVIAGTAETVIARGVHVDVVPSTVRTWQKESWVEDCAKYSELADCNRRYYELRRASH